MGSNDLIEYESLINDVKSKIYKHQHETLISKVKKHGGNLW